MATLKGDEAWQAALDDMDCIELMGSAALQAGKLTPERYKVLRPYLIAAFYQLRMNKGELDKR